MMVAALSHVALGFMRTCPDGGRGGAPLNREQLAMVSHLDRLQRSMRRLADPGLGLAGCSAKVITATERLQEIRARLGSSPVVPYARPRTPGGAVSLASQKQTTVMPGVASRIGLPAISKSFDPLPWFDAAERNAYEHPDSLLREAVEVEEENRRKPLLIRSTFKFDEKMALYRRWDDLRLLRLFPAEDCCALDIAEPFPVVKTADEDRQIIDKRRRNRREVRTLGSSKTMGHGSLLNHLELLEDEVALFTVDDLEHFYHQFGKVSDERARACPIGAPLPAALFKGFKAVPEGTPPDSLLQACWAGLSMGDHLAVDFAQSAHSRVLQSEGCLQPQEWLRYDRLFPLMPSKYFEGVVVDDRLSGEVMSSAEAGRRLKGGTGLLDTKRDAAYRAYGKTGLKAKASKARVNEFVVEAWGAQVEGDEGLNGAHRSKILHLMLTTAAFGHIGVTDAVLLESIIGSWNFVQSFRKHMYALFFHVYQQRHPSGKRSGLFEMTQWSRNEILLAATLGPCTLTDLRAQFGDTLYCVDASPYGAGACQSKVGRRVVKELWRRADKRGFRTNLLRPPAAALKASGHTLDECMEEDLLDEQYDNDAMMLPSPSHDLLEIRYDVVEVYGGCHVISTAGINRGLRTLVIELKLGHDMEDPHVYFWIAELSIAKRIKLLVWEPPCTTYSIARNPKLRSMFEAWGFKLLDFETAVGNFHCLISVFLAYLQMCAGHWHVGEQPWSAFTKYNTAFLMLFALGCESTLFDWCRYGRAWVKTTLLVSNAFWIGNLGLRCTCPKDFKHITLEGSLTTQASAYSEEFGKALIDEYMFHMHLLDNDDSAGDAQHDLCTLEQLPIVEFSDGCGHDYGYHGASHISFRGISRKHVSHLWSVHLAESLTWAPFLQYHFNDNAHINLKEARAHKSVLRRVPRNWRGVIFQDTKVGIGANNKGRSSSPALNRIMVTQMPLVIGRNLYPASLHQPTWALRADDPSRFVSITPARAAVPRWFWLLRHGATEMAAALLDQCSYTPRAIGRWFLVGCKVLQLLRCGGGTQASDEHTPRHWPTGARWPHGPNGVHESRVLPRLDRLVGGSRPPADGTRGAGCTDSSHRVSILDRVRTIFVQQRPTEVRVCRDAERTRGQVPLDARPDVRSLACDDQMARARADHAAQADATERFESFSRHSDALELVEGRANLARRLLWLVESHRVYVTETRGLLASGGPPGRSPHPDHDHEPQDPQPRSQAPIRQTRRAWRCGVSDHLAELLPEFHGDLAVQFNDLEESVRCIMLGRRPAGEAAHAELPPSWRRELLFRSLGREPTASGLARPLAKHEDVGALRAGVSGSHRLETHYP